LANHETQHWHTRFPLALAHDGKAMKVIITRPVADSGPLADKLVRLGHEPVIMPLLQIVSRPGINIPDRPWQAICMTSANGPRAVSCGPSWKLLPVYTVGQQSKAEAERQGYGHVVAEGGDVEGLARYIIAHLKPESGPILYLSGAATSGDLEGKLASHGFTVHREIVYDAVPMLPANVASTLRAADSVLLYSPRSAKLWHQALESTGDVANARHITHICLSPNVARQLPQGLTTLIAATPDESALLSLLDQAREQE
jgi:uroporphyrinogen-III synthase